MIGSSYWLTCFFRKNGFVAFFVVFERWKGMVILMALGVGCDGLKCRANMPNRAMHNIYIYAQLVVWRRWLVFLWLRFWDAVLWRKALNLFQPVIAWDPGDTWQFQSKLKLCFFSLWYFHSTFYREHSSPDSPPSSQKMFSRTTSLQQKHCVDCCPWKGTLLGGKQSSNHHFSEAGC